MNDSSLPALAFALLLAGCQASPEQPDGAASDAAYVPLQTADGEPVMGIAEARERAARLRDDPVPPRSAGDLRALLAGAAGDPSACAPADADEARRLGEAVAALRAARAGGPAGRRSASLDAARLAADLADRGRVRVALALLGQADGVGGAGAPARDRDTLLALATARARVLAALGDLEGVAGEVALVRDEAARSTARDRSTRVRLALAQAIGASASGRLAEAELRYREALAEAEPRIAASLGVERARVGAALAENLLLQGLPVEAEAAARRALAEGLESASGGDRAPGAGAGASAAAIAASLHARGRLDEAELVARQAVALLAGACIHPGSRISVEARRVLLRTLAAAGDWDGIGAELARARAAFAGDAESFGRAFGADPEAWYAAVRGGEARGALRGLEGLVDELAAERGDAGRATLEARGFLGLARAAAGDERAALEDLRAAARPYLEGRRSLGVPGAAGETGRMAIVLRAHASLLGRLAVAASGEARAALVDEHFRLAQVLAIGRIQRAFDPRVERAAAGEGALAALVRESEVLASEALALEAALDRRRALRANEARAASTEALAERLARVRADHDGARAAIATRHPRHGELMAPRPVGTGEAQRLMRPGEALVVFDVALEQSWAWAIPQSGPIEYAALGIDARTLGAWVDVLRAALAPGRVARVQDIPAFDVDAAHALFRSVLSPVAPGWRTGSHLLVVPDGALSRIPLGVLPTSSPTRGSGDDGARFAGYRRVSWLGHEHAISTLPAVASLVTIDRPPGLATGGGPLAAYADPVFAPPPEDDEEVDADDRERRARERRVLQFQSSPDTVARASATLADLPPLPETVAEAQAVAGALGAEEQDVYLAERASERNVLERDLGRRQVLLFATHALAGGALDGQAGPALALSNPAVVAAGRGDGLLTLDEIVALGLDADWVVLTGLDAGLGDGCATHAAALGRAFLHAGARTLLVSHWPVESGAAAELFTSMAALDLDELGRSRAELLQLVMRRMLETGVATNAEGEALFSYAHPIFWAPFSAVGDGRSSMR